MKVLRKCLTALLLGSAAAMVAAQEVPRDPNKEAYFGNFHVHTNLSFDAFTNGAVGGPDGAYRWAKGEAIKTGDGLPPLKIERPLDWYMVSDHSEYLGIFPEMADPNSPISKLKVSKEITSDDALEAMTAYTQVLRDIGDRKIDPDLDDKKIMESIWQKIAKIADKHYAPGKFTTFAGFEWTANPEKRNLHRVVVFRGMDHLPKLPISALDTDRPEDLWAWLDTQRANGAEVLAIPHNGNASDGLMFPEGVSYGGSKIDSAYAEARMRNEPVYEVSQIKGTSETHPSLSPNDEFAGFEIWDYTLDPGGDAPKHKKGSYLREALTRGLRLQAEGNGNPFKYGMIGDSDTHNLAAAIEEDNYTGKFGFEMTAEHRLEGPPGFPPRIQEQIRKFSSGGVAGVWAESNTREDIFDGVAKKETFATSGPRMKVRFFGGYDYAPDAMMNADWVKGAYAGGVPMGGDLKHAPEGKAPVFLVAAMKEPGGANLDRVQIIKGWVENGKEKNKIYDVALSGDRKVGENGSVPPVGNTVNAAQATYTNDIGAEQLVAVWSDPDFDADRLAFYYVRALEIPTPRWSTYDAKTLGVPPRDDLPATIQERAWSSPIWYTPAS